MDKASVTEGWQILANALNYFGMDEKDHQKRKKETLEGGSVFEEMGLSNGNGSLFYTWVKTSWHWIISVRSLYRHKRIGQLWTDCTLLSGDKDKVAEFLHWKKYKTVFPPEILEHFSLLPQHNAASEMQLFYILLLSLSSSLRLYWNGNKPWPASSPLNLSQQWHVLRSNKTGRKEISLCISFSSKRCCLVHSRCRL